MKQAKVGSVVVTCPACGDAKEAEVVIDWVKNDWKSLKVEFRQVRVEHECEGRH